MAFLFEMPPAVLSNIFFFDIFILISEAATKGVLYFEENMRAAASIIQLLTIDLKIYDHCHYYSSILHLHFCLSCLIIIVIATKNLS